MAGSRIVTLFACAAGAFPGTAAADELRDFCVDRPGLGAPACTIDRGHAALEIGAIDWTLERDAGARRDSVVFGDALLRYGLTDSLEIQLGWQAYGRVRERARDRLGARSLREGTGDVTIALRRSLAVPEESRFSVALMPVVTLPTGGDAVGAGEWSAGVLLPVGYALGEGVDIAFTAGIDNAADADGEGHHLAYGGVLGLGAALSANLAGTVELAAQRDEEPGSAATALLAGFSLNLLRGVSLQFDAGANLGLNRNAPDVTLYLGFARRF